MARPSWLVNSRGFAMKVMNAADSAQKKNWRSDASIACPNCSYRIENSHVTQDWPGLPAGVKFEPSDQELLRHLSAKVGNGNAQPHPFIDEFILTLEEENGICYTHPENFPGVKQDGSSIHIFHKTAKAYATGPRKCRRVQSERNVRWHKTGATRAVYDGRTQGRKKIMVLYTSVKGSKAEKTKWVMHQYHLGTDEDENDGEFVVSKISYQQDKPGQNDDPEDVGPSTDKPGQNDDPEDVGPSTGKGDPVTPKTSTPPQRSWNQHASPDGVIDEYLNFAIAPQAADLDATIHPHSKGNEAESDRQDDLPNATVVSTWSAGESQLMEDSQEPINYSLACDEIIENRWEDSQELINYSLACDEIIENRWEDSQEPINHSLACDEILVNRSCEANIEGGNSMASNLTECGRIKSNKSVKELHPLAFPELENIDLDTPPDGLITDSQFSSQDSIWHVSWLTKNMDWASSMSGKSLGDSQ